MDKHYLLLEGGEVLIEVAYSLARFIFLTTASWLTYNGSLSSTIQHLNVQVLPFKTLCHLVLLFLLNITSHNLLLGHLFHPNLLPFPRWIPGNCAVLPLHPCKALTYSLQLPTSRLSFSGPAHSSSSVKSFQTPITLSLFHSLCSYILYCTSSTWLCTVLYLPRLNYISYTM